MNVRTELDAVMVAHSREVNDSMLPWGLADQIASPVWNGVQDVDSYENDIDRVLGRSDE